MAGVVTGLDYAGVEVAARSLGYELERDLFDRLRIMEGEALAAFAERRK